MKRRILCLLSALLFMTLLITTDLTPLWSADTGAKTYTKTIKTGKISRGVNVVEIDLNKKNISLQVVTPYDRLGGAESFSDMIKRKKPLAAINANFFNAYTNLEPLGTIMKNGEIVFLGNSGTTLGITKDNQLLFFRADTVIKGALDGKYQNEYIKGQMQWNAWQAWNINNLDTNDYSVAVYTPARGEKVKLKAGMAVVVENEKVSKVVETPLEIGIPKSGFIIYYGKKSDSDYKAYVRNRYKVGRTVEYQYAVKNGPKDFNWDRFNNAITAGPRLMIDGQIKVNPSAEGFKEAKITKNRGQRSALGVTKDNRLLLVTVSDVNVYELADIMKALGAHNAMNLDGGASSGLYYGGKMITAPGRKLSTVLMVFAR